MYLCEAAIVSQLCISFPYVLHGLCEDYLTCDIAFNAVMPPSRASTHGRYSRIEGVTAAVTQNNFRATVEQLTEGLVDIAAVIDKEPTLLGMEGHEYPFGENVPPS